MTNQSLKVDDRVRLITNRLALYGHPEGLEGTVVYADTNIHIIFEGCNHTRHHHNTPYCDGFSPHSWQDYLEIIEFCCDKKSRFETIEFE